MIEVPYAKDGMHARKFLEMVYLPQITGRVLSVGVASYTMKYPRMVPSDCQYETIDIDPERAQYGAPRHYVGDFLKHEKGLYDHVVLMGLDPHNMPDGVTDWLKWQSELMYHAWVMLRVNGSVLWGGTVGDGWETMMDVECLGRDIIELFQYGTATQKGALAWLKRKS